MLGKVGDSSPVIGLQQSSAVSPNRALEGHYAGLTEYGAAIPTMRSTIA